MNMSRTLASISLAGALAAAAIPAAPAMADGAASTRNIIGGAVLVGGTLLVINHNKKVHQKEAELDSARAYQQERAASYESAYASEHQAYQHQVAINAEYKHEVAVQHSMIVQLRNQVASVRRASDASPARVSSSSTAPVRVASGGWGSF